MRLLALMACALLMAGGATTRNEAYRARRGSEYAAVNRQDRGQSEKPVAILAIIV